MSGGSVGPDPAFLWSRDGLFKILQFVSFALRLYCLFKILACE